jgi:hypothetical protein
VPGIHPHVTAHPDPGETDRPPPDDAVRCLGCGTVYAKPLDGSAGSACPACGDVSWLALAVLAHTLELTPPVAPPG